MAWWLFQNTVVTLVLAIAVIVLCRFVRFGPVARHALWVLVLVKFITPPVLVWPWAAPDPFGLAVSARADRDSFPGAAATVEFTMGAVDLPNSAVPAVVPGARDPILISASELAGGLWMLGALLLICVDGVRVLRLARRVREANPIDPAIAARVEELSLQLGLMPVTVVAVPGLVSPMVWCFGRTRLLWPEELTVEAGDACIDGLIVHELAHVKRRDHLVGWLELAAGVVWWWNPLFWFVRACLREQAELSCDAWVISTLPNGRRAYAESLLALSGAALRGTPSAVMAVMGIRASSRHVLERRLVMIMKGRAPLRLPAAGVLTIVLTAAATLPAWATGQQTPPPPPPPAPAVQPQMPPPPPAAPAVQVPTPKLAPVIVYERNNVAVRPAPAAPVAVRVDQTTPPPPPPPPTPRAALRREQAPAKAAPQTAPPKVVLVEPKEQKLYTVRVSPAKLPADGQQLIQTYTSDVDAIYKEIEAKAEARRQAAIKALEALQDQYTKQGKLDEAVAIRDYLKAGGPPTSSRFSTFTWVNKGGR